MDTNDNAEVNIITAEEWSGIDFLGTDFAIFDRIDNIPIHNYPTKIDPTVVIVCLSGTIRIGINLREYVCTAGNLVLLMPDHIVQHYGKSDDFSGIFLAVSPSFMKDIIYNLEHVLNIFFYVKEYPCTMLKQHEVEALKEYHSFLWKKIKMTDNIYKREIAQNMLKSLFYDICNIFRHHIHQEELNKNRKEELFGQYLRLVVQYYKENRHVSFYADKLFLTPKYLSTVVKEISKKSAGDWIDSYVILEAKAWLKSSGKTIQEISNELNFANQSFFGKYFKQHTGMSPGEYRKFPFKDNV